MMLNQEEIEKVGDELASLAKSGGPLSKLVHDEMRPSGRFQKYVGLEDSAFMRASWVETAQGVNHLYRIYAWASEHPPNSTGRSTRPATSFYEGISHQL
jgi:hypothetical protein